MWGDAPARGRTGHRGCCLSLPRFTRFVLGVGHLMVGTGQSQDSAHGVSLGSFVEVIQFTHFKHTAQWSLTCYLTHLFTELGRSPREGNGNPLPCSCLESPTDRGVWWAPVHGGRRSRTRLSTHTVRNKLLLLSVQFSGANGVHCYSAFTIICSRNLFITLDGNSVTVRQ